MLVPQPAVDSESGLSGERDALANAPLDEIEDSPDDVSAECSPDWAELVDRIKRHDQSGLEDLYRIFSRGIRFFLCRQLGPQELDDRVHDTFLIVVHAIQRGDLREPERLMGFVRTVVRKQVAAQIDRLVHSRREKVDIDSSCRLADHMANPEQRLASQEV